MLHYMRILFTVLALRLCQSTILLRQQAVLRSATSDLLVPQDAEVDRTNVSPDSTLATSASTTWRKSEVIVNVTLRSGNSSKTTLVNVDSFDDAQTALLEAMAHFAASGAQEESMLRGSSRSNGSWDESQAQDDKKDEKQAMSWRGAASTASDSIDAANMSMSMPLGLPAASERALTVSSSNSSNPFKHFADKLNNKVQHAVKSVKHATHKVSKVVSGFGANPFGENGVVGRLVEDAIVKLAASISLVPGFDKDFLNIEVLDSPLAEQAIDDFVTTMWGPSALTPTEIKEAIDGASKVSAAIPGVIDTVNQSLDDASFSAAVTEATLRLLMNPAVQDALRSPAVQKAIANLPMMIGIMQKALSDPFVHEAIDLVTLLIPHVVKTMEEINAMAAVVHGFKDKSEAASLREAPRQVAPTPRSEVNPDRKKLFSDKSEAASLRGEPALGAPPRVEAPRQVALTPSSKVNPDQQKLFADELAKKVLQVMKSPKHVTNAISRVVSGLTSDPIGQNAQVQGLVENATVRLASSIARIPGSVKM